MEAVSGQLQKPKALYSLEQEKGVMGLLIQSDNA